ncbi:hypothetical protein SNEBB_008069 [Seison nebaliae]|nr:hypothetical protein SNEBB_008069 [Seison nebaliae]
MSEENEMTEKTVDDISQQLTNVSIQSTSVEEWETVEGKLINKYYSNWIVTEPKIGTMIKESVPFPKLVKNNVGKYNSMIEIKRYQIGNEPVRYNLPDIGTRPNWNKDTKVVCEGSVNTVGMVPIIELKSFVKRDLLPHSYNRIPTTFWYVHRHNGRGVVTVLLINCESRVLINSNDYSLINWRCNMSIPRLLCHGKKDSSNKMLLSTVFSSYLDRLRSGAYKRGLPLLEMLIKHYYYQRDIDSVAVHLRNLLTYYGKVNDKKEFELVFKEIKKLDLCNKLNLEEKGNFEIKRQHEIIKALEHKMNEMDKEILTLRKANDQWCMFFRLHSTELKELSSNCRKLLEISKRLEVETIKNRKKIN